MDDGVPALPPTLYSMYESGDLYKKKKLPNFRFVINFMENESFSSLSTTLM